MAISSALCEAIWPCHMPHAVQGKKSFDRKKRQEPEHSPVKATKLKKKSSFVETKCFEGAR
jgi:hypothetical protein